jgi:hypothetical protein
MKISLFIIMIVLFSASTIKAQNKAQQDNNQFVTVVQTQKTTGRVNVTHYTMTNINSVSMDFTLYKQSTGGTWLTTHSLNLNPGQTFEDESSAIGLTGKYVLYSAPHSTWASFPSFMEMAALQSQAPVNPQASANPTTTPPPAPMPAAPTVAQPAVAPGTPPPAEPSTVHPEPPV